MTASAPTIREAVAEKGLFASHFRDRPKGTWTPWWAFLSAVFALPMSDAELAIFKACTALDAPPTERVREAWLICGAFVSIEVIDACTKFGVYEIAPDQVRNPIGFLDVSGARSERWRKWPNQSRSFGPGVERPFCRVSLENEIHVRQLRHDRLRGDAQ